MIQRLFDIFMSAWSSLALLSLVSLNLDDLEIALHHCSVKRIRDPISLYRLFQGQIFICVAIDISNIQLLLTFMFHHLIILPKIFQPWQFVWTQCMLISRSKNSTTTMVNFPTHLGLFWQFEKLCMSHKVWLTSGNSYHLSHIVQNCEDRDSYLYGFVGDKHNLTRKQILQEFTDVRLFDMNRFLNQTYHPFTIKGGIFGQSPSVHDGTSESGHQTVWP